MGMLKSLPGMEPLPQLQPLRPLPSVLGPSRNEMQSVLAKAGGAGVPVASQADAGALMQLYMAGVDDKDALADVAWAVKMGGTVPDAVAKVLAARKSI